MFTLVTGRGGDAELTSDIMSVRTNVPGCTMIGAQTFDFEKGEILDAIFMPADSADMVRRISDHIGAIRVIKLYCMDHDVLFSNADEKEFEDGLAQIDDKVCKIVIVLGYKYTPELFAEIEEICGDGFNVCSNGADYFEITAAGISKGNAALKLKEKYGAKLLVCAGDSNGDISMIKAADIGYAVDNAIDDLKSAADSPRKRRCSRRNSKRSRERDSLTLSDTTKKCRTAENGQQSVFRSTALFLSSLCAFFCGKLLFLETAVLSISSEELGHDSGCIDNDILFVIIERRQCRYNLMDDLTDHFLKMRSSLVCDLDIYLTAVLLVVRSADVILILEVVYKLCKLLFGNTHLLSKLCHRDRFVTVISECVQHGKPVRMDSELICFYQMASYKSIVPHHKIHKSTRCIKCFCVGHHSSPRSSATQM